MNKIFLYIPKLSIKNNFFSRKPHRPRDHQPHNIVKLVIDRTAQPHTRIYDTYGWSRFVTSSSLRPNQLPTKSQTCTVIGQKKKRWCIVSPTQEQKGKTSYYTLSNRPLFTRWSLVGSLLCMDLQLNKLILLDTMAFYKRLNSSSKLTSKINLTSLKSYNLKHLYFTKKPLTFIHHTTWSNILCTNSTLFKISFNSWNWTQLTSERVEPSKPKSHSTISVVNNPCLPLCHMA